MARDTVAVPGLGDSVIFGGEVYKDCMLILLALNGVRVRVSIPVRVIAENFLSIAGDVEMSVNVVIFESVSGNSVILGCST